MGRLLEVRMPRYPECWETCGNCANGDVFVLEVLVAPGDAVAFDDGIVSLETGKVALDIPSPYSGRVARVCVGIGDVLAEGDLLAVIDSD
jgi:pyruvate/2-oxoglutarate dehydrogenase complex dihydrolipoamide acyltransferase (E2) component